MSKQVPEQASKPVDIAIIGAGAAGLAAGIFAAEADLAQHGERTRTITILDGAPRVGAKIMVSGGGRCNVTNTQVRAVDFHGSRNVVKGVLKAFGQAKTVAWFESLGVKLKTEDTGKLFPVTDSARTIVNALVNRCRSLSVRIATGQRVSAITHQDSSFQITTDDTIWQSRRLMMATGGRSLPKTGSDGAGWSLLKKLGHSVTPTWPALAPLVLDDSAQATATGTATGRRAATFHKAISGLTLDVTLSTYVENRLEDRRSGSMLFTHFGVSGPVVMDASRFWLRARMIEPKRKASLRVNFLIDQDFAQVEQWMIQAMEKSPTQRVMTLLNTKLPSRLVTALMSYADVPADLSLNQLSRDTRRQLVHALTDLPLPVLRDRGWNYAEVTAGGVPLTEIDRRTFESKHMPGLYLVGEILDCDGRIGGFNFQWAWSTGHLAGTAVSKSFADSDPP